MVQLTLPKNSRITRGKVWPKPEGGEKPAGFQDISLEPLMMAKPRRWIPIS